MDKNQQGILSKDEIDLIRNTFGGKGEEVLYEVRNLFFQFPVKETMELEGDVLDVLQKYVLPEMDSDLPIGQQNELFFTLDKISEYHPDVAVLHIQAMDKMVAYLNARFSVLCGEELVAELKLSQLKEPLGKSPVERYVDMIAFQNIVAYLEKSFSNLKILAESREETEEEKEKRLEMDSTK